MYTRNMDQEPRRRTSHYLHVAAHYPQITAAGETEAAKHAAEQQQEVASKRSDVDLAKIMMRGTMANMQPERNE